MPSTQGDTFKETLESFRNWKEYKVKDRKRFSIFPNTNLHNHLLSLCILAGLQQHLTWKDKCWSEICPFALSYKDPPHVDSFYKLKESVKFDRECTFTHSALQRLDRDGFNCIWFTDEPVQSLHFHTAYTVGRCSVEVWCPQWSNKTPVYMIFIVAAPTSGYISYMHHLPFFCQPLAFQQ